MKTKIYDLVKRLLTDNTELRNSDRKLIWHTWRELGLIITTIDGTDHLITYRKFMESPSTESIRRARQLIQARHPELGPTEAVRRKRAEKEKTKSTFVYREEVAEQQGLL